MIKARDSYHSRTFQNPSFTSFQYNNMIQHHSRSKNTSKNLTFSASSRHVPCTPTSPTSNIQIIRLPSNSNSTVTSLRLVFHRCQTNFQRTTSTASFERDWPSSNYRRNLTKMLGSINVVQAVIHRRAGFRLPNSPLFVLSLSTLVTLLMQATF